MEERWRALGRDGLLRRVWPFGAVMALALAVGPLPPTNAQTEDLVAAAALTALIAAAARFVPWQRLPSWAEAAPPLAYFIVIFLLRQGEGGMVSGLTPLLLLPVVWFALYGTRPQIALAVLAGAVTLAVPIIANGAPEDPPSQWWLVPFYALMALIVGVAIDRLMRETKEHAKKAKSAQRQLRLHEDIVKNMRSGLVVSRLEDADDPGSLRVVFVNPAADGVTGADMGATVAKTLRESFPSLMETEMPALLADVVRNQQAADLGEIHYGDERVSEGDYHVTAFPLPDRCVGVSVENVTARNAAEAKFRHLLETAPDAMVIVDSSGRIVLANAQTETLFGYSGTELIGQPVERLIPERFRHEHERHREDFFAKPRDRRMGAGPEFSAVRKDGTEFPAEISLGSLQTDEGTLATAAIRDITERKKAETALRRARDELSVRVRERTAELVELNAGLERQIQATNRLAAIVEHSHDAIVSIDLDGTILSWNRGAEKLYGYVADEVVGEPFTVIFPSGREDEVEKMLGAVRGGERIDQFESERLTKGKRTIEVQVTVSPIRDKDGRVAGASSIARDITESKRIARELAEANARLLKLDEMKSDFVATASHELRTPIAIVKGGVENVLDGFHGEVNERQRSRLETVKQNAAHMAGLVNQLLDLSRLDSESLELQMLRIDLRVPVLAATNGLEALAGRRGVQLVTAVPDEPITTTADAQRLAQVVNNLVENALDFAVERVRVELGQTDGNARLVVEDDGPGVPPDQLDRIFERFARVPDASGRAGTGLGLAIVRGIVESHGGRVWAENAKTSQRPMTRFTVSLPISAEQEAGGVQLEPGPDRVSGRQSERTVSA